METLTLADRIAARIAEIEAEILLVQQQVPIQIEAYKARMDERVALLTRMCAELKGLAET